MRKSGGALLSASTQYVNTNKCEGKPANGHQSMSAYRKHRILLIPVSVSLLAVDDGEGGSGDLGLALASTMVGPA